MFNMQDLSNWLKNHKHFPLKIILRLNRNKFFRCGSKIKFELQSYPCYCRRYTERFFSINKQITVIIIIMQIQASICVFLTIINANVFLLWVRNLFFSIFSMSRRTIIKNKIIAFLANPLTKVYEPALSNVIQ